MKALLLTFLISSGSLAQAKIICASKSNRTHVSIYFSEANTIAGYEMGVNRADWAGGAFYVSESLESSLGEQRQFMSYTTDHYVAKGDVIFTDLQETYQLYFDINHRAGWGYAGETFNVASFNSAAQSARTLVNGYIEFGATLDIRFDEQSPWGYDEALGDSAEALGLAGVVARKWTGIKLNCIDDRNTDDLPGPPGPGEG